MNESNVPAWQEIHQEATVVDLHAHPSLKVALFRRHLAGRYRAASRIFWPPGLRTSFDKLQAGGVDVLMSAVYVPEVPILEEIPLLGVIRYLKPAVWKAVIKPPYFQAAVKALDDMELEVENHNQVRTSQMRAVQVVKSVQELEAMVAQGSSGPMALIHAIEGAHNLQGEKSGKVSAGETSYSLDQIEEEVLANLEHFFHRGVAYLTLAHFFPNRVVYPTFPFPEHLLTFTRGRQLLKRHDPSCGLTRLGEKVVRRMLDLGMIIDLSHSTPAARAQVYRIVDETKKMSAVMATHVGAYAVNPSLYNLEDWEIKWLADHGGVVGVIFMNYWLMPHETKLGLNFISRHIEHIVKAGGSQSVAAFGSDFDGFTDPPDEMVDASELPKLTQRLSSEYKSATEKKYTGDAIGKILGGNALRMLREGWGR